MKLPARIYCRIEGIQDFEVAWMNGKIYEAVRQRLCGDCRFPFVSTLIKTDFGYYWICNENLTLQS